MMHLFQNPSHAGGDVVCLDRFPKKLKEVLKCSVGAKTGWGLYFVESWDAQMTWLMSLILFVLGSLMIGVLWAVYKHSIQDAFSIASYMVAFATVTSGTIQVLIVKL